MQEDDLKGYPHREGMVNDLISNHKLKGLTYYQLIDLIGKPEGNVEYEANLICYPIRIDYGLDIDPVYTKYLCFKLNRDSLVVDIMTRERKK